MSKPNDLNNRRLDRVHHIALIAADLEASTNWFLTSFSGELVFKSNTCSVIQYENIQIVLVLPSQQQSHIAFLSENAADFGPLQNQIDNVSSTLVADPFGNIIELVANTFAVQK